MKRLQEKSALLQFTQVVGMLSLLFPAVASADTYVANNCEVFIDRAQTVVGSHSSMTEYFWVKTLNNRLDGNIVRVAAVVHQVGTEEGRSYLDHTYEIEMTSFFGANDYWGLNFTAEAGPGTQIDALWTGSALEFYWNEQVQVYVETDKGSRYYAQTTDSDGTYKFDGNLGLNLQRARGGYMPDFTESQVTAVNTANSFPYLNPSRCR
jgi:hypothetical protein